MRQVTFPPQMPFFISKTEKLVMENAEQQRCLVQARPSDVGPQESALVIYEMADDPLKQQELGLYEADSTSRSTSASPPTSGEQQQPAPTRAIEPRRRAKRSRNLARERLQSELKYLRALYTDLEQRLTSLQQQQGPTHRSQEEHWALVAWEYVAERQLHERTRVEKVNVRLRAQVQSNLDVVKRLQQAAHEVPGLLLRHPVSFGGLFDLSFEFPRQACIIPEEIAVYETLSGQVDAAFASMESVFTRNGLSTWRALDASELATQAQMKTQRSQPVDGGQSLAIELVDVDVLPFAKESVFRAMWRCWEQQYLAKNAVVYEFENNGSPWLRDAVAGKMQFVILVDNLPVALQIAFVLKWFIEDGRVCYVWRATTTADASLAGVSIDETGWEELRTVDAQDAGAIEGTLVLSCSRLESMSLAPSISSNLRGGDDLTSQVVDTTTALLASALISSYEADLVEVSCLMMDLLLEETGGAPLST